MRDLIVTQNITLDGVIEATEGWFDPAGGEDDVSDVETALRKQREAADALLLGRVTFEQMRGYWPLQTDDPTGITAYFNGVSKYVVSSALQDPEWERTVVLRSVDDIGSAEVRDGRGHRDHRQHQAGRRAHRRRARRRIPALHLSSRARARPTAVRGRDRGPAPASGWRPSLFAPASCSCRYRTAGRRPRQPLRRQCLDRCPSAESVGLGRAAS
jgi:hypothetical protein